MASIKARKAFWWTAFFTGAGGLAMFAYLCMLRGPPMTQPPECYFYLWPPTTLVLAVVSAVRLRRCYAEEPTVGLGLWQLRLADLLVVSFIVGLLYACFQAFWPTRFVQTGYPVGLLTGVAVVVGLLRASRNGMLEWKRKYAFGVGFALEVLGGLCGGGMLVLCLISIIIERDLRTIEQVSGIEYFACGLFCWPVGWLLCRFSRWGVKRE